jgi:DNA-binding transcriptional LysR family regulator
VTNWLLIDQEKGSFMDRLLSMRVFQQVIDQGGFAAAARALDMSPAGVTRLVTDLEQHLGARLMQRTTRKLSLTEAGEAYLLRVRSILGEVDDAEAAAAHSASDLQGVVHVLAPPLFANQFLAKQISRWVALYPRVTIDLHVDPFPQSRVEEFDVTFMVVNEGFDANIVARPVATNTLWILCASPAYLARHGTPQQPQDLQLHHYLRFPWPAASGHTARGLRLSRVDGSQEAVETAMQVVMQSTSYDALFTAALDGAGIAVLPQFPAANYLNAGALVHVLPDWFFGRFTVYAALPTRKLIPARTRAFLDFASEMTFKPMEMPPAPCG